MDPLSMFCPHPFLSYELTKIIIIIIIIIIASESDLHVLKDFHLKPKHGMLLTTG